MRKHYETYAFFSRVVTDALLAEQAKLAAHLRRNHPNMRVCDPQNADLLLVLGGDGTLLEAVRAHGQRRQHLLAFNLGHEGFLTTVRDRQRLIETLDKAIEGRLSPMPIPAMQVIHRSSGGEQAYRAVNDITIECTMTWLRLRVESVSGKETAFVKDIRGSGACLCSAIGSTSPMAVHLHAPRMDPSVRALYVKGIHDTVAPQAGLLLSAEGRSLRFALLGIEPNLGIPERHRHPPALFLDGIRVADVRQGDHIEVRYAPRVSELLRLPEDGHWERVRGMRF